MSPPPLTKARLLFVDDENAILTAMESYLRPVQKIWQCEFVNKAELALERLRQTKFHVLVTDLMMPGMNGATLLTKARTESPETIRVILTGTGDLQIAAAAVNDSQVFQLLLKPCGGEQLLHSLANAIRQYQLNEAERALLRTQFENAEKLAVVGQLAAGINRDLDQLFASLMLQTQTLLTDSAAQKSPRPILEQIQAELARAAQVTAELGNFTRAEKSATWDELDLRAVIESCLCMVRPLLPGNITLHTEMPPLLPSIEGDAAKLKQALMNLVLNARDAMPRGGAIKIGISERNVVANGSGDLRKRNGQYLCLAIRDTGHGMDATTLAQLFKPLFTTKTNGKGTGLGLYMVNQILEQHSGWVEVESAPGRGTFFQIFLPTRKVLAAKKK